MANAVIKKICYIGKDAFATKYDDWMVMYPGLGPNTHFEIKYRNKSAKSNRNTLVFQISNTITNFHYKYTAIF